MGFAGRDGCGVNDSKTCRQSYVGKTHITTLEYPVALSVFVDLRSTRGGADASRRPPGDKGCGTHLVPVSESDKDPSRNILEWKRTSVLADADPRYEVGQITLQFQKSIDSTTTTITVWGSGFHVSCPFHHSTPFFWNGV